MVAVSLKNHVVGLGIDPDDAGLVQGLVATRDGRDRRAREMADALAAAGIPGAYEGALRFAGNPALISRTHVARHLVETGVCRDTGEVFRRFLVPGTPGHVPHRWAALDAAVGWITGAGGVAVLAHPGRYHRLGDLGEHALFEAFQAAGGQAVEVVTGSHRPDQYAVYAERAQRLGLMASRGSDFHSPEESRIDLGGLPPLPASLTPVWGALSHRVLQPA